ncbi:hypothetical protein GGR55DRAFT_691818 [Xylaria sp. FL0064]|nr:hypothetical protein GGR55DRAFT_691818 [Xylaria sp. FL0064]
MAPTREPSMKGRPSARNWARLGIARMLHRFPSGELSNGTSAANYPNDTSTSTQTKASVLDNSPSTVLVRPLSRSHSKTFPQSNKEKGNTTVKCSSIDARLLEMGKGNREVEDGIAHDEAVRQRRLQPVPEEFQDLEKHPQKKLYEKLAFDTQLKALEVAVRREQKQSLQDSKLFVDIWESRLLPKIEQVLDDNVEGEYTVNVSRGPEPGKRTIVIMTAVVISNDVEKQLRKSKSDILPSDLDSTTLIIFRKGRVEFLADPETSALSRVSSHDSEDSVTSPLNTDWSPDPAIGDSVGWEGESASLGPLLLVDEDFYRLVCWHLFDDKATNRKWSNAQPPERLSTYCPSTSDSKDGRQHHIGDVVAYSGPMYKTTRLSVSINQDHVVTDWALVQSTEASGGIPPPNITDVEIRQAKDPASFLRTCEKKRLFPMVYSVGRTSGYTTGQLGLTHGRHRLSNGRKTKNWTVENLQPHDGKAVSQWIRAGMGVPGDSGPGVFGFWGNELLGQIWGRNTYDKNNTDPRFTFFTALGDIYADIIEKMPGASEVRLPNCLPTNNIHSERDLTGHEVTCAGNHSALPLIREEWNDAALEDDDYAKKDQEVKHRSAANSRRLDTVIAFSKKAHFFEPSDCQPLPLTKWARFIIHAATF